MEQAVEITDSEITIKAQFFIHKDWSITRRDVLIDILARKYAGQTIRVLLFDGENAGFSGFNNFMLWVCENLNIDPARVIYDSHNSQEPFTLNHLRLGIFITAGKYLPEITHNVSQSRFVGCLLGRYNINRVRLAYELDSAFPNDTFITFQPKPQFVAQELQHFSDHYKEEVEWVFQKTFDKDLISRHFMGMIDWQDSSRHYGNVCNQYQIEVVSETDSISNHWFTEKTANCLASGKPFVLVSGQGSLQQLRDWGFQTFDEVLDESYDQATNPFDRIRRLTNTLTKLYTSPDKSKLVSRLYQLASQNIEIYKQFIER